MLNLFARVSIIFALSAGVSATSLKFEGTIETGGDGTPINGQIKCTEESRNHLEGEYFYTKVGTPIRLSGRQDFTRGIDIENHATVLLREEVDNEVTGTFFLAWHAGALTGYWANMDNYYQVSLTPQPVQIFESDPELQYSDLPFRLYKTAIDESYSTLSVEVEGHFIADLDTTVGHCDPDAFLEYAWVRVEDDGTISLEIRFTHTGAAVSDWYEKWLFNEHGALLEEN